LALAAAESQALTIPAVVAVPRLTRAHEYASIELLNFPGNQQHQEHDDANGNECKDGAVHATQMGAPDRVSPIPLKKALRRAA
jgi:hypothetical protein